MLVCFSLILLHIAPLIWILLSIFFQQCHISTLCCCYFFVSKSDLSASCFTDYSWMRRRRNINDRFTLFLMIFSSINATGNRLISHILQTSMCKSTTIPFRRASHADTHTNCRRSCEWDHLIGGRTNLRIRGNNGHRKEERVLLTWAGCPSFLRGTRWVYSVRRETMVHNRSAKTEYYFTRWQNSIDPRLCYEKTRGEKWLISSNGVKNKYKQTKRCTVSFLQLDYR